MKILYLHGLGSQPGGLKPTFLRNCGYEVVNPALPDDDFDASVRLAQRALEENRPDAIVGSSRGGAVAVNLDVTEVPVLLIAPAWKKWGAATTIRAPTVILHSQHDDVVSLDDSRELLTQSGLSEDHLILVGDDHLMVDEAALSALRDAVHSIQQDHSPVSPPVSLAPPGGGLPNWERVILKYLLLPIYCRFASWKRAVKTFGQEGTRLIELAESLTTEQFREPVLVARPRGIEDSSRCWSAEMVLEHLIEVGSRIAVGIVELTHGETPSVRADIVEVKPRGERGYRVLEDYRLFLEDYTRTVSHEIGDRRSRAKLEHPWFGQLTAHQLSCLSALHQRVHRRQMERIVGTLREA